VGEVQQKADDRKGPPLVSKTPTAVNLSFSFRTPSTSWLESGTTINRGKHNSNIKSYHPSVERRARTLSYVYWFSFHQAFSRR